MNSAEAALLGRIRRWGELAEWFNAAVLKTAEDENPPGVRIPHSPSPPCAMLSAERTKNMQVQEILKTKKRRGEILNVAPDSAVMDAVNIMVENDTGSVVVFGEGGKMAGMLTFREVLRAVKQRGGSLDGVTAADIMDTDPGYATPQDSVDQVRNLMTNRHIRYLPVMEEGKLTDIISFYDVARAAAKEADFENRMLKQYIGNWPEADDDGEDGN